MDKRFTSLPGWAGRFLRCICPDDLYEEIEGDLIQHFNRNVSRIGYHKSYIRLCLAVLRFFRPGILFRNRLTPGYNSFDLVSNDLRLAFRQLNRNRMFSLLNIAGLSISIAVVLLIVVYTSFHYSFDKKHQHFGYTYRVYERNYEGAALTFESALTNYEVASILKNEYPEVKNCTQLMPTDSWFDCALRFDRENGAVVHNERKLFFADQQFFEIFAAEAIAGDLNNALTKPFSVVLTRSAANRYFDDGNPIGKVLHLKGSFEENNYEVTAVIEDLPANTHLDFEILMSLRSLEMNQGTGNNDFYTYITVERDVDVAALEKKLSFLSVPTILDASQRVEHRLQAVKDIHLYSNLQDEMQPGADAEVIYFLIAIGIVIISIAWINYVNLSISRIFERARQVGIRKVTGATKSRIVGQFFTESVVINLLSLGVAVALVRLAMPLFQELLGIQFSWNGLADLGWHNPAVYILLILGLGVMLSALYPSRVLAALNPIQVLKGKSLANNKGSFFGGSLITFQFTCSIVLAIAVIVIHEQYSFMQNKKLGVDIDQMLIVKAPSDTDSTYQNRFMAFKNYASMNLQVKNISTSTSVPGENIEWTGRISNPLSRLTCNGHIQVADTGYFQSYNIQLLHGRNFNLADYPGEKFGQKTEPVILNEKAAEMLGFASLEDAIDKTILWENNRCTVVGVVGNYHQQPLKSSFKPIVYTANSGPLMSIKLARNSEKDFHNLIVMLEKAWQKFFPNNAFDFFYLPDFYKSHYRAERNMRTVIDIISALALVTSCLGLLGISSVAAKRRLKEVTVRKVLGAGWTDVVYLLSKKIIVLICVSVLIAVPLALIQCVHWLGRYAFHIDLRIWHFTLPVALVVLISFFTIMSQCWKVFMNGSINVLKSE
ncbi:MAG TPA: ABC transporter permease [Chryseosolibacter sp.]|nr:ABC transporter permease [Chryseosolibacter sp.]